MLRKYETEARAVTEAIKALAGNPVNLDNLESYLSIHFADWINKYASTPADMASELKAFSTMDQ